MKLRDMQDTYISLYKKVESTEDGTIGSMMPRGGFKLVGHISVYDLFKSGLGEDFYSLIERDGVE